MNSLGSIRVKLVAIAKDEGAYLSEWIFHHLRFGFDSIDIYVNSTSDNSRSVINKISRYHDVNLIEADKYRERKSDNFQLFIYNLAIKSVNRNEFTHIAFLDIDEFWTPLDFQTSVKAFLKRNSEFDVSVFNWFFHMDENDFSRCFKSSVSGVNNKHVKSISKLEKEFAATVHSVKGDLTYCDCNGVEVRSDHPGHAHNNVQKDEKMAAFVVHRAYRGQMEYVSLLARGRPRGDRIKNNRFGYYNKSAATNTLHFESSLVDEYYSVFDQFICKCNLERELAEGREFVVSRYSALIQFARGALSSSDQNSLISALRRVEIEEVKEILQVLKNTNIENLRVFQIGFNKCGTASIFHYFNKCGFKSIHWDNGNLSKKLKENYEDGKPLLQGYEEFQVFTDMEHREDDQEAFYSYQNFYKELDIQYPNSLFILNTRNVDKWIASRLKHPNYLKRTMHSTGLNEAQVIDKWREHFFNHINDVKSYFECKSNLIQIDLDKDSPDKIYREFKKRDIILSEKELPHQHKTASRNKKKSNLTHDQQVNRIRDAALFFEETDVEISLELMKIAQKLRPEGTFIVKKVNEYQKRKSTQKHRSLKNVLKKIIE